MREVLFRGKRLSTGEWIEGQYTFLAGLGSIWAEQNGAILNFTVDPETVGQWTGFADKNGTKIFEWDIGRYDGPDIDGRYAGLETVVWESDMGAFALSHPDGSGETENWMDVTTMQQWVVLGNVFDNPELLEDES